MTKKHKPSQRCDRVWRKLATWYGARLVEQFGTEMPEDWCALVDKTDDQRLHQALLAVRRASPAHPPTLGQLEMCIPARMSARPANTAEELVMHATRVLKPCKHQLAIGWPTFGDALGIAGLVVPGCKPCGLEGRKFKREELLT